MAPKFKTKQITVPDHAAIGAAARSRREASGKSLRQVARELGISAPFLSDLERGKRNWCPNRHIAFNLITPPTKKGGRK